MGASELTSPAAAYHSGTRASLSYTVRAHQPAPTTPSPGGAQKGMEYMRRMPRSRSTSSPSRTLRPSVAK